MWIIFRKKSVLLNFHSLLYLQSHTVSDCTRASAWHGTVYVCISFELTRVRIPLLKIPPVSQVYWVWKPVVAGQPLWARLGWLCARHSQFQQIPRVPWQNLAELSFSETVGASVKAQLKKEKGLHQQGEEWGWGKNLWGTALWTPRSVKKEEEEKEKVVPQVSQKVSAVHGEKQSRSSYPNCGEGVSIE